MAFLIDDLLLAPFKLAETVCDQLLRYTRHECLTILRNQLKELELLYERKKISEEFYRKRKAVLTALIEKELVQLRVVQSRIHDVRIV